MRYDSFWRRICRAFMTAPPPDARAHAACCAGDVDGARPIDHGRAAFETDSEGPKVLIGPRVLILTSGLGCGHTRAAQALRLALVEREPSCTVRTVDWWSLMNVHVAETTKRIYLQLVTEHSDLYEQIYHLDQHTWRELLSAQHSVPQSVVRFFELLRTARLGGRLHSIRETFASDLALASLFCASGGEGKRFLASGMFAKLALFKWSWARLVRRLGAVVDEFRPDVVVSTQMIPAALFSSVKQQCRLDIPSIAVVTDFGIHDFWNQAGTDLYCLGHASITEMPVGFDTSRIAVTGLPLMPGFANPTETRNARRHLGLCEHGAVVLVLGGGLGIDVDAVAARLSRARADVQLLVLRGRAGASNDAIDKAGLDARVRVFDWTERVDIFIRAADIVVGKCGGLTVAEVLACGRPLLATRSLRGQEGFNVRFMQRHCVGGWLTDDALLDSLDSLLQRPDELMTLKERVWRLGQRDGAQRIANRVLSFAGRTQAQRFEVAAWRSSRNQ